MGLAVSQQFSNLFNAYCKSYNKKYNRKGSLFIPRFKRKQVDDETYFSQLIAYIHLNSIKHGFCKHILEWKHSSIHAYYLSKETKVNKEYLYKWFGNKEELIRFHESFIDNDMSFDF